VPNTKHIQVTIRKSFPEAWTHVV